MLEAIHLTIGLQNSRGLVRGTPKVSAAGLCNSEGELPDDHRIVTCLLEIERPGKIKEERVASCLSRN